MQRVPPELTGNARRLRRDATPAERLLWQALRGNGPRFTRQLVVGHHIIDIACRRARVGIELDGGHHAVHTAQDDARSACLAAQGWRILRFWSTGVIESTDAVVSAILSAVAQVATHPRPLPSREGR